MNSSKWINRSLSGAALLLGLTGSPVSAQRGVVEDVLLGLEALQFQFSGGHNPLSLGFNGTAVRTFQGETLDFGAAELSLSGPFQTSVEYGTRGFKTLDLTFSTAGQPLQYLLTADTGGQSSVVSGSFLLDGRLSVNQFGFYDMHLEYSSRQDIANDGRYSDENVEQDFDLGPVDISGNIYADILATIFDPIFQATNTNNIFASFSGRYQMQEELERNARLMDDAGNSGDFLKTSELAELLLASGKTGATPWIDQSIPTGFGTGPLAIPEPSLIVPLTISIGIVVRRRSIRRK